jgi:hypothetical protein
MSSLNIKADQFGLFEFINPDIVHRCPCIRKIELSIGRDDFKRGDVFFLYATGRITNKTVRTILDLRPIDLTINRADMVVEISRALEKAIPILEATLRLAGEPK